MCRPPLDGQSSDHRHLRRLPTSWPQHGCLGSLSQYTLRSCSCSVVPTTLETEPKPPTPGCPGSSRPSLLRAAVCAAQPSTPSRSGHPRPPVLAGRWVCRGLVTSPACTFSTGTRDWGLGLPKPTRAPHRGAPHTFGGIWYQESTSPVPGGETGAEGRPRPALRAPSGSVVGPASHQARPLLLFRSRPGPRSPCSFTLSAVHSLTHSPVHLFINPLTFSFIHPFTSSFIHPLNHSFIHSLTCSFINPLVHLFIHPLTFSFIHSFTSSFIYPLTHSFIHSLTCSLIHPLTCSFLHPLTHSFIHSLTHLFTYSLLCSLTHSLTHSLIYSPAHSFVHSLTHTLPLSLPPSLCGSWTSDRRTLEGWGACVGRSRHRLEP